MDDFSTHAEVDGTYPLHCDALQTITGFLFFMNNFVSLYRHPVALKHSWIVQT